MNGITSSSNASAVQLDAYKELIMKTVITNGRLVLPYGVREGSILVEDGKIQSVSFDSFSHPSDAEVINADGCFVSPGFIDMHTHGAGGYDFMDGTVEDIYGACRAHLEHGTTTIMPTSMTSTEESLFDFIKLFNTVELVREDCPEILGLHLEGPYFAPSQAGAQDPRYLRNPQPEEYERVLSMTDRIRRWSFAVELPGSDRFLSVLKKHGILSSAAHTDANCQEIFNAFANGVELMTHFYSCMPSVRRVNAYRVAGAIEAGYLLDDMYVEIIADGCHLPAELLKLIYKIKGSDRICLITDSMRAAGMPDGEYWLGQKGTGIRCIKEDGVAKLPDRSAFAGSVATTDRLVRTMINLADVPLYEAVKMATLVPAHLLRIDDRKGVIAEGRDADILIFNKNIEISKIMLRGRLIR